MFPKPVQDTGPQSFPDGHPGDGFLSACLPFALGSTTTMATSALDLLSDWLAYRSFSDLDLPWRVQQLGRHHATKDAIWGWDSLYKRLPDIFFYFMILATVVFLAEVVRFSYMFRARRNEFKEKRDGLPYKKSFIEKCGSEIFIILHVCMEDLPVSLVFLAVQVAVSCQVFLALRDKIYLLCMAVTCFSLCWKVLQIVWNAGCLGRRGEYHKGYKLCALRIGTLILLTSTLGVATVNLLLFPASNSNFKGRSLANTVLDKVGIHHWSRSDHIVFMQGEQQQQPDYNFTDNTTAVIANSELDSDSPFFKYVNLIKVEDVLYNEGNWTFVSVSCAANSTMFDFVQPHHKTKQLHSSTDCKATFIFLYDSFQESIYYNYAYRYYDGDQCIMGNFTDHVPLVEADWSLEWAALSQTVSATERPISNESIEGKNISHRISLSPLTSQDRENWVKCSYQLVLNESVPLDMCPSTR